jgi:hypothetical protein
MRDCPYRLRNWPVILDVQSRAIRQHDWSTHARRETIRSSVGRTGRRDARRLHPMRQVCRGLPKRKPRRHRRREAGRHYRRHHRARADWPWSRSLAQMGTVLHVERGLHQGLRLWRQSALPSGDGAWRDAAEGFRPDRASPRRRGEIPRDQPGRRHAVAAAARPHHAGAAGSGRRIAGAVGRAAGLHLLYRLQRSQDPAHRPACARHHGQARRQLSGDGRSQPLLRGGATSCRRPRDERPDGTCSSPRRRCRRSSGSAARGRSR